MKRGKHQKQSRSESEIKGRDRRAHEVEQTALMLNDTHHEEEGESGDGKEKEKNNRQLTNKESCGGRVGSQ